jgi:hypothetical protein
LTPLALSLTLICFWPAPFELGQGFDVIPYLMAFGASLESELRVQMGKISILDADVTAAIALGFL